MNPFDDDVGGFGAPIANRNNNVSTNNFLVETDTYSTSSRSLQTQITNSQSRTKASQQRALASIYNSEEIGVVAAQELVIQGEKLGRAEEKLDEIGNLQKESQKRINTLSSVFGGLKNMFSRRQSQPSKLTSNNDQSKENNLSSTFKQSLGPENTTSMGFMVFNDQLQKETMNPPSNQSAHDLEFDRNLSLMNDGMSRLKNLAQGMNNELLHQNKQLDRMAPNLDRVNETMVNQNRQMNKLLGVKPK